MSLHGFSSSRFGYFLLSFFFFFLHFHGILIIVGELVIEVLPNSFSAEVRFVCYENELLALIDKINTFAKLGNACLVLSCHDGILGLIHRRLHLFVLLKLLLVSLLLKMRGSVRHIFFCLLFCMFEDSSSCLFIDSNLSSLMDESFSCIVNCCCSSSAWIVGTMFSMKHRREM